MTLDQIYKLAIRMGIQHDLRGEKFVHDKLKKEQKRYSLLKKDEKQYFDEERLHNPYADSRVHYGYLKTKIKRALVGIDIDTAELCMVKELKKEKPIDLVISHHPVGKGLIGIPDIVTMQCEIMAMKYNVPITVAQQLIIARVGELTRMISPINHYKTVNAARLLDIPFISLHTTADNMVANFLFQRLSKIKPLQPVEDVLAILKSIPEYQEGMRQGAGPILFAGKESNYVGKIALTEMTGGTAGSKLMYERLSHQGIGTIVGMHMEEEYKKEAEKNHLNVIIAGHISSDSLGLNLLMDEFEKHGVEILPCSGYIRISRNKK